MNKGKKNLGVKIETALLEKLDQEATRTRRTRSQTVEVLIDNLSIDSNSIIEEQAKKIKELEREVILLRSDKPIEPMDNELIEANKRLATENRKLTIAKELYENILTEIRKQQRTLIAKSETMGELLTRVNK